MHLDSLLDAQRLAAEIELLLAELNLCHRSLERLQHALNNLVRRSWPIAAGVAGSPGRPHSAGRIDPQALTTKTPKN